MAGKKSGQSRAHPGAVLKAQRLRRGWTLAEVSERTGLPVSTLSKVENDKMALTYDKLTRLSQGLEIDISRLFGEAGEPQEPVTTRRSINRAGEGSSIDTRNYGHLYSATDLLNKRFVPCVADIKVRSIEEFGELVRHPGEEYAFVIEGAVDFHTSLYAPVRLNTGDSVYFDSGMGHAYVAAAPGSCKILSICTGSEVAVQAAIEANESVVLEGDFKRKTGKKRAGKA